MGAFVGDKNFRIAVVIYFRHRSTV